jgi:hypothetical protein
VGCGKVSHVSNSLVLDGTNLKGFGGIRGIEMGTRMWVTTKRLDSYSVNVMKWEAGGVRGGETSGRS